MRRIGTLVLTLSALAAPLQAQSSAAARLSVPIPDRRLWHAEAMPLASSAASAPAPVPAPQARRSPASLLTAAGLLAAAGSFIGGAYLGGTIENEFAPCDCDDPGVRGAMYGAAALPPFLIPVAVHLANRGGGSFASTLAGSLIGGAGIAGFALANHSLEIGLFGTPIGALAGAVIGATR